MAIKKFRPLTPTQRYKAHPAFTEITTDKPEKSLLRPVKKTGGRNNNGRLTARHRGGGHKRRYRLIDFKRLKRDVTGEVLTIEYDPNRTSRIALIQYPDGEKQYIIAPEGLGVGDKIIAGDKVAPAVGNALPLSAIPLGSDIHNVELIPGRGGQIARSAGQAVVLTNREGEYALCKMPSGEIRKIHASAYATMGRVGNGDHMNVVSGKAGRTRWLGKRPHVRGMAMNPIDHPNGGGEGRSKGGGGRQHPMSPWGQLSNGFKTRKKHKPSNKFIVERKKKK